MTTRPFKFAVHVACSRCNGSNEVKAWVGNGRCRECVDGYRTLLVETKELWALLAGGTVEEDMSGAFHTTQPVTLKLRDADATASLTVERVLAMRAGECCAEWTKVQEARIRGYESLLAEREAEIDRLKGRVKSEMEAEARLATQVDRLRAIATDAANELDLVALPLLESFVKGRIERGEVAGDGAYHWTRACERGRQVVTSLRQGVRSVAEGAPPAAPPTPERHQIEVHCKYCNKGHVVWSDETPCAPGAWIYDERVNG